MHEISLSSVFSGACVARLDYRADIDGLRAVAVMAVVLFHVGFDAFSGGFVGVDIFFVISGFLITRLMRQEIRLGTFTLANFYDRRARRIFPALLTTVAACFVLGFLLFSPPHLSRLAGAAIYALTGFSNFYFWMESGYFDAAAEFKPLLHTWSLSVEEQFYFVWPVALLLLSRAVSRFSVPLFILLIIDVSVAMSEYILSMAPSAAFYLIPFRIGELMIGALAVWISDHQPVDKRWLEPIFLAGLAMAVVPIFTYSSSVPFPGIHALAPCTGTAMMIYAGAAPFSPRLLTGRPTVYVGLVSYSYYLAHWPLIVFYKYFVSDTMSGYERISLVVVGLVIAIVMHEFIEKPFRHGKRARQLTPPAYGLACALLALLVVLPASGAWANGGWVWRIAPRAPPVELVHELNVRQTPWHREVQGRAQMRAVVEVGSKRSDAKAGLLIGDSHAGHLMHLVDYVGSKYNFKITLFSYPGCPPIFGAYKIYGPQGLTDKPLPQQEQCRKLVKEWESLVRSQRFDLVLLSARWMWLYEPTEYGDLKIRRDYLVAEGNPVATIEASRAIFRDLLEGTVRAISSAGAKVVIFSQVPLQGKSLDGCDSVPDWLYSPERIARRCYAVDKKTALNRLRFTDTTIREVARITGARAVIPSDIFCTPPGAGCVTQAGRTSLYADESHLNEYGSIYLARAWEKYPDFPLAQ